MTEKLSERPDGTGTGKNRLRMLPVIFALAWPTMLEQLMQTTVQYIDTAMVGSLGTKAVAAVGSTSTVGWLVMSSIAALGVGFLAYIAQAYGAGDMEKARRASAQAVLAVLATGVTVTVLAVSLSGLVPVWMNVDSAIRDTASRYFLILYLPMLFRSASTIFGTVLRAVRDTKTPMRVGIAVNIINVVLNFFLIYPSRSVTLFSHDIFIPGAGLGVEGAAAASAVSFVYGGIAMTVKLLRHKEISPRGQSFRPDPEVLRPCLRVAVPNMLQRFGTSLGYVVFASMINSLGEISTAAHTVANTVESLFYIPGYGMQMAAATLVGNAYGARDGERMKSLARTVMPLEITLMVISGGLLFIFAPQLMSLFSSDGAVISLGTTVLRMVAVSEPFFGVPIVIEGMMQGVGRTVTPFVYNIAGMWGVRIVGTFIFTQLVHGGLVAAWGCMIAHNMLLFVLFGINYLRGKWNPMQKRA